MSGPRLAAVVWVNALIRRVNAAGDVATAMVLRSQPVCEPFAGALNMMGWSREIRWSATPSLSMVVPNSSPSRATEASTAIARRSNCWAASAC